MNTELPLDRCDCPRCRALRTSQQIDRDKPHTAYDPYEPNTTTNPPQKIDIADLVNEVTAEANRTLTRIDISSHRIRATPLRGFVWRNGEHVHSISTSDVRRHLSLANRTAWDAMREFIAPGPVPCLTSPCSSCGDDDDDDDDD